ncbi:hypothetical protein G3N59_07720 [Paraburkholderia sp. Ac-20340]|uniref:hypothetical protein n=1 Tax=Paraburkholderia sp. Ac-20340 TaxID=2703888 RepID=UPI0019819A7E|nr:hypothetical protein [Paraburkholderia sp. Ac-20340]MBN3853259.1 hypothetical protein [Paraburkholderia sp. Ac-20340]
MTVPFLIASGLALGVSLAAPGVALADAADTANPPAASAATAPPDMPAPRAQARESRYDSDNPDDDKVASTSTLPPDLADTHSEVTPIDGEPIALTLAPLPEDVVAADASSTALPKPVALASGTDLPAPTITSAANTAASAPPNSLDEPALSSPLAQELISGFYSRINVLGYGIVQDPVNSTLNPNNALAVHRYETQLLLRPDFNLTFRQLELGIKPRFEADWSRVQNGVQGGTDITTATSYINEWIARYHVTDQLLVSYGRENLQWGPSQLLSPSNPFNQNNGKNNPAIEQPGMDYGRVVAIPNSSFTGSFIANTGSGRLNESGEASGPFHKAYAGKFDYTGEKAYASLIVSKRDTTPWRIGYFGGWNISDALLLYSEGSAALSTNAALPHPDYDLLAGATYTLLNGAMITGEYFHHNAGCTQNDVAQCVSPLALDPTNPYPRRDYLLLQYVDTKLVRNVSLTVRLIQDLNDHSTQLLSDVEYEVGQNWLLYFVPSVTFGPSRSEFGSLVRYSIFAGVSFTF